MDYMQYKDTLEIVEVKVNDEVKTIAVVVSTVRPPKAYDCSKNMGVTLRFMNNYLILSENNLEMKLVQDAINLILNGLDEIQNLPTIRSL